MLQRSLRALRRSQYIYAKSCLKFHTSVCPVLYARFDKDLPNPCLPTPASKIYSPDVDILLEQLKKCDSLDRLLELMNQHLDVMNSKHIVSCLENIHKYAKGNRDLGEALLQNATFKTFCARLMKVIRLFDPQEVITTYKALCTLEVRNNTYVMQCVLKMLASHLNNMSLGQITFLSFLLHKQRHNSLVDGIRLALPLVLQVQIDHQLNSDNLTEVVNCLQISCRSGLRPETVQKIVNAIIKKASILNTTDAMTIIFSLLNIETPIDGYNELMEVSFQTISRNVDEVSPQKLITVLRTCRTQRYSHFKFFFALSDLIIEKKWDLELTYSALSHFLFLGFCPPKLLDHFSDVLCIDSQKYLQGSYSPLSCIEYLTTLAYQPVKVDEAARIIYAAEDRLENMWSKYPHLFVKFLSCLAMIGHFPQKHVSKILNEDLLFDIWSTTKKQGRGKEFERYMLFLYWGLKLYGEEENFVIPHTVLRKIINFVHQRNLDSEYPLAKFIESGLGGSQFLQSGVFTEDGHVIDHIVAMRTGNFPVSLKNVKLKDNKESSAHSLKFVEDIVLPEDAKIIAILVADEKDYIREFNILKGYVNLKMRCLAKKNFGTLVVNYSVWNDLPDREKIPYLMREIKQAVPEDNEKQSNYFS